MSTIDPLGDGISSVELLEVLGSDLTVVNAARVSLDKHSEWQTDNDGLEYLSFPDKGLIGYLADHNHWTPFGHPQLQFRVKMPIFVAREWFRHTIGFVRNEVSRRYVDHPPEFWLPDEFRLRAAGIKQGSSSKTHEDSVSIHGRRKLLYARALKEYEYELSVGIAPEVARELLPQAMYTEFYETASLYAYARLYQLRISKDAQRETCAYAEAISSLIEPAFPVSWPALRKDA